MHNTWVATDGDATDAVHSCAYGTRLLGAEPSLVIAGGGNASIKAAWTAFDGRTDVALYVTPSGIDLADVTTELLVPMDLERLRRMLAVPELSDRAMTQELTLVRLRAEGPRPSVETLLHTVIPAVAVFHTHADAILALADTASPHALIEEALGRDAVTIIPYRMPGFTLASHVALTHEFGDASRPGALVLLNHGLVTYGPSARAAFDLHIELVSRAEAFIEAYRPSPTAPAPVPEADPIALADPVALAELRRRVSVAAGRPLVAAHRDGEPVRRVFARTGLLDALRYGPLTPDHAIWTKPTPLVGDDVDAFCASYLAYVDANRDRRDGAIIALDPAPRVVYDDALGLVAFGTDDLAANRAREIASHTAAVAEVAEALGGYRPLEAGDVFDLEYWELEQAKLAAAAVRPPFGGEVALVTGAASGIGRACALELLAGGAAIVGLDIASSVAGVATGPYLGIVGDAASAADVQRAIEAAVERFGGLDILVASAGIFGASAPIAELGFDAWRRTMSINLDGVFHAFQAAKPFLARAPGGGRVVLIASKNVPAPGPGAAAYSASKAAATQLARVAALEWANDGIRVNMVHPDAVFDTGLWTPELLAERAAKYGMSVDDYKRRNLLRSEVTSATVAQVVAQLCSPVFRSTTGAQIPIDGGSDRVI